MAMKCPQCGAKNDDAARRCRVCANLLNAAAPEVEHKAPELPEHVQRRIENVVAPHAHGDTHIPSPSFGGLGSVGDDRAAVEAGGGVGAGADAFDPDALFDAVGGDLRYEHLPPPPAPPSDELTMPPEPERPDLLTSIELPPDATTEDIERAAAEALRQERLGRRPGILNKVFKPEGEQ